MTQAPEPMNSSGLTKWVAREAHAGSRSQKAPETCLTTAGRQLGLSTSPLLGLSILLGDGLETQDPNEPRGPQGPKSLPPTGPNARRQRTMLTSGLPRKSVQGMRP